MVGAKSRLEVFFQIQLAIKKLFSCLKDLLKNGMLEIGWKLLKAEESRLLFFRRGFIIAIFIAVGRVPVNREWLTIAYTSSGMQLKTVLKKVVGTASRRQVRRLKLLSCDITFLSMSVSTRENKSIVPLPGWLGHISSNVSSGLAWLKPSLLLFILSLKNIANSSPLEVEESSHIVNWEHLLR